MGGLKLRLKLFLRDRTAIICWLACAVIMISVLMQLNLHAAERSALPVGLEIRGNGALTERAAKSFRENEALYVYEGSYDTLYGLLADGYIYCIVSINENFDSFIMSGKTDEIMTLYSAKDDKVATIVGDIAAGCCIDAVCMYKAYNTYDGLNPLTGFGGLLQSFGIGRDADDGSNTDTDGYVRRIVNINEYSDLLSTMEESGDYDYDFAFEFVNTGSKENREITNGLIYRQVIVGLMGLLLMLCAFCTCSTITKEYENGIRERIRTSAQPAAVTWLAEIAGLFICSAPLSLIVLIFGKSQGDGGITGTAGADSGTAAGTLAAMVLINVIFVLISTIIYYFLANILRSVFAYQILGAFVMIALGICGFISIFEGLQGGYIFGNTPMGIYIRIMCGLL
ncbi:MAG: ABC transporter permease [Lachnospiraceae bacterium]|nr:ABC transporter permease [Lachnospiraceae bacterium]